VASAGCRTLVAGQKVLRIGRIKPRSGTQPVNAKDARMTLEQFFSFQFGRVGPVDLGR
jgi:hypothetical protein